MKSLKKLIGPLIVLVLLGAVYSQRNAITDWWRLRGYTPPANVAAVAAQDTMTAKGRHLFYINHPQIVSGVAAFRQNCPDSEQAIVLGCYHPGENGIYIYNVQDAQLYGVQQVTAAHEMLHAAYGRLSAKDKNYIDGLLENYYKNDLTDPRVQAEIKLYQQTEPNDVVNEMHSVFGTEVANLPTPLENYYKRYFTNRQAVTDFAASYQAEFTNRQNQITADDAQLTTMKAAINVEQASLQTQSAQIDTDRAQLDSQKNSGDIAGYNAGVDNFNAEVAAYNRGVTKLQTDITSYNNLVATRNSIAANLDKLDKAIDTRLTTQVAQ